MAAPIINRKRNATGQRQRPVRAPALAVIVLVDVVVDYFALLLVDFGSVGLGQEIVQHILDGNPYLGLGLLVLLVHSIISIFC
jgi:hypothetical protein